MYSITISAEDRDTVSIKVITINFDIINDGIVDSAHGYDIKNTVLLDSYITSSSDCATFRHFYRGTNGICSITDNIDGVCVYYCGNCSCVFYTHRIV